MNQRVGSPKLVWRALLGAALLAACGGDQGPTATGHLRVQIIGLPAGAAPRVRVSGPGNEVRSITQSVLLTGLLPGTYTVSALHVRDGAQDYTATVSPGTVELTVSGEQDVTVTYAGGPPPTVNFHIDSYQLFQSTQNAINSVPMVASRAVFLRIFAVATEASTAPLKVRIRIYRNGALVDSVNAAGPAIVPTAIDLSTLGSSWNATIPASRIVAGLGFDAVVDPDDELAEANESDNRYGAVGAPIAPAVVSVPAVQLRLVPVLQEANGHRGSVTAANQASYSDLARRIFPISQLTVDVRAPFTTSAPVLMSADAWARVEAAR